MGGPGEPRPGGCGLECPGPADTRGWKGGRSQSLPSGAAAGARGWTGTGTGAPVAAPTPIRGTGTMVSPGPPLPLLLLSLSEGADRDWRHETHRAWYPPVPVPVHAPGLSLPTGGTRPLGVVARAGLSVSLCVPVPRVLRVPRRAPWSRCPRVCSDPAMFLSPPVLILGWLCTHVPSVSCPHGSCAPPLAVLMSLRCPCPRGRALSPG